MNRFIYVTSQDSAAIHRLDCPEPVDSLTGRQTACGLTLTVNWRHFDATKEPKMKPFCSNCERAKE